MSRFVFRPRMPRRQSGGSGLGGIFGRRGAQGSSRRGGFKMRLVIAAGIALFALASYFMQGAANPITGKHQRVGMNIKEGIALGLRAAPEMIQQHGGELPDPRAQAHIDAIGERLLRALDADLRENDRNNPFQFEFHLLSDPKTINAFALPGGQVFMTQALYSQLETEGQVAGVIGHEIGHVLERHGAQRLAKGKLTQGLVGAAGVAGGDANSARMAAAIGQMINMKYGRGDELESDQWGVRLMTWAGYDPRSMLGVMNVLEKASAGGPPEFMSTHPKPANRKEYILEVIATEFPDGLPEGLEK